MTFRHLRLCQVTVQLLLGISCRICHAYGASIIPSAELFVWPVATSDYDETVVPFSILVTQAHYGSLSPMNSFHGKQQQQQQSRSTTVPSNAMNMVHSPNNNLLLCENNTALVTNEILQTTKDSILVVPRGICSFEYKTYIAQTLYEASAVAIYNTLAAQYRLNDTVSSPTSQDILWPISKRDYDCDKGKAEIASNVLDFDHPLPYNAQQNDPLLSGNTQDNLCKLHDVNNLNNCISQRCLVAHDNDHQDNDNATMAATFASDTITVCCAWDFPLEPVADRDFYPNVTVTIPTVFLTMQQGDRIQQLALKNNNVPAVVVASAVLYSRWKPTYNPSSLLIWLLGVLVATVAAYGSASDYHWSIQKWLHKIRRQRQQQQQGQLDLTNSAMSTSTMLRSRSSSLQEETLELQPIHALLFVIMASTSLLVLFFFKVRRRTYIQKTL
jgi:hypothetical protein